MSEEKKAKTVKISNQTVMRIKRLRWHPLTTTLQQRVEAMLKSECDRREKPGQESEAKDGL